MDTDSSELKLFVGMTQAAALGIAQLTSARIVDISTRLALLDYHFIEELGKDESLKRFLFIRLMDDISPKQFHDYEHVTQTSYLVYATAILDSFLTEASLFLFLRNPAKLKKNDGISWDVFLNRDRRAQTIVDIAKRRTRDIAFWPLDRRIEFLQKTFDLTISIGDDVLAAVKRYAIIRNIAVHDHSAIELTLDASDKVTGQIRAETIHRQKTSDVQIALYAISSVIGSIFVGVSGMLGSQTSELKSKIDELSLFLDRTEKFRADQDGNSDSQSLT